jgi:CubicO group peptidase (beta-lactamase class C family)
MIALLLAGLLAQAPAPSTASAPPEVLDAGFDAYVAKARDDWRVPGLAISVVKDGRVVFAKGYGVRELGRNDPVDEHTIFAIGSTTKAMTAALVGMLVDEGKLQWDDPVTKHLPWFQLKDPYVTRELTVRDLLTHRAGLGNADFLWYGQDNSPQDILRRIRLADPAYSLRSGFIYQNIMYAVAGAVVEAAGGKPWEQAIQTRIFDPLGMRDTIPTISHGQRQNMASPHLLVRGKVRVIENASVDSVAPAGSVWSSVSDMAKWMQFLLDGGRVGGPNGKRLLSEKTAAELFKPQTIAPQEIYPTWQLVKPHWMTYGLGWFQQDYQGRAVDFHTGSIDGMVAIHGLIRDEKLGVYALANLNNAEVRHALMYTVFDRYGGRRERDWSADLLKLYADLEKTEEANRQKQEAQRVSGTSPSLALEKYAGTYSDPLHGEVQVQAEVQVVLDGDQDTAGKVKRLRIRYGAGLTGTLEHWHYNTFRVNWAADWRQPSLASFILDAQGQPATLEFVGARFTRRPESGSASSGSAR